MNVKLYWLSISSRTVPLVISIDVCYTSRTAFIVMTIIDLILFHLLIIYKYFILAVPICFFKS